MNDFIQRFVILDSGVSSQLPFTVGGISQKGDHGMTESMNNQDAMSLYTDEETIIGVLCDGCTSGPNILSLNAVSFSETGAQLLSALALKHSRACASDFTGRELATKISNLCLEDINRLLGILAATPPVREHLLQQFFMATLLIFVVTPKTYTIMHYGDGIIAINGQFVDLNLSGHSGQYLANGLSSVWEEEQPILDLFSTGETATLNNILLASDGISDILQKSPGTLEAMLENPDSVFTPQPGWGKAFFQREFNKRVGFPFQKLSNSSHDDRTLLMLRHLPQKQNILN